MPCAADPADAAGRGTAFAIVPSSSPISAGPSTISATPSAIALRGIWSNCAVDGSCANVSPPTDRIARSPSVPSLAVPERTTPTARSPRAWASEPNSASIGRYGRLPGLALRRDERSSKHRCGRMRRHHDDRVGLDAVTAGGVDHRQLRALRQQAGELAGLRRRQVLQHDNRKAGIEGDPRDQLTERIEPTRRRSDAYHSLR